MAGQGQWLEKRLEKRDIIHLVVWAATVGVGWGLLRGEVQANGEAIANTKAKIEQIEAVRLGWGVSFDNRLDAVEKTVAKDTTRVTVLLDTLAKRIERMDRKLDAVLRGR